MSTSLHGHADTQNTIGLLRYAVERAVRAPSIHNTQPWRFVIRDGRLLELWADPSRQLTVLDPSGRQLTVSCGCALFNVRVALAACGYKAVVERCPDLSQPTLLARIVIPSVPETWVEIGTLDSAIDDRRTNRRQFLEEPLTPATIYALANAASAERAVLLPVTDPVQTATVDALSAEANRVQEFDPAYRAELEAWTTDDPRRADGIQVSAVPYASDDTVRDDLALRRFDYAESGWLPSSSASRTTTLLLIGTMGNELIDWLRTGEALQRVWLELTRAGYSASPITQIVEVRRTNYRLRDALKLFMNPALLLRVGHAPEVPRSARRSVDDVLTFC